MYYLVVQSSMNNVTTMRLIEVQGKFFVSCLQNMNNGDLVSRAIEKSSVLSYLTVFIIYRMQEEQSSILFTGNELFHHAE